MSWCVKCGQQTYSSAGCGCPTIVPPPLPRSYKIPHVCRGNGLVAGGFYAQVSGVWSATGANFEQCRSCTGTGVVWEP